MCPMSILKAEYRTKSGQLIQVRYGDLTQEETDAVVNAANSRLAHGAMVAEILEEYKGLALEDIQACLLFATKSLDINQKSR